MKLRLLGPFPPPYGGVAIHLVRLLEALRVQGHEVEGISVGGVPNALSGVRTFSPTRLIDKTPTHYHTDEGNSRWMVLLSTFWRLRGTKRVVTVHSFRHRDDFERPAFMKKLRRAYQDASEIIAISQEVRDDIRTRLDLSDLPITVIGSDLPVSDWEKGQSPPSNIPDTWTNAGVRVLANAGRIVRYQGHDLYGIDVLIDAMKDVSSNAQCLVVVGEVVDADLMEELERAAAEAGNCSIVLSEQGALAGLVGQANVVVRPTRTEGGRSLTLSEALELGTWAIGSDAVPRPEGTQLFKNGDSSDLRRALHEVTEKVEKGEEGPRSTPNTHLVDELIKVYERNF